VFCSCTFASLEYLLWHMPITPVFFLSICTLHSWFCCKLWLIPDINPFDCFGFPRVFTFALTCIVLIVDGIPSLFIHIYILVGTRGLRTLWGANVTCQPLPFLSYREKGERRSSSGTRAGVGDSPGNTRALFRSTHGKELGLWPGTQVFVGRPGFVTDPI